MDSCKTISIISRGVETEKKQELKKPERWYDQQRPNESKVFCIARKQNRNNAFAIAGKLNQQNIFNKLNLAVGCESLFQDYQNWLARTKSSWD